MRTVTITAQIQFDVNGTASDKKILKAIEAINEALQETNLNCQPQILVERETDYLLNSIEPVE